MSAVIVESGRPVSLAAVESGRQTCSPTTVDSGRRSRRLACMSVSVQRAEQAPGGETISVLWARRRAPRRGGWRGSDFLVAPPVGGGGNPSYMSKGSCAVARSGCGASARRGAGAFAASDRAPARVLLLLRRPSCAAASSGAHLVGIHVAGGGSKLFVRYKTPTLDTIRYNVSDPSLDTMDTYFPSRAIQLYSYTAIHAIQHTALYSVPQERLHTPSRCSEPVCAPQSGPIFMAPRASGPARAPHTVGSA